MKSPLLKILNGSTSSASDEFAPLEDIAVDNLVERIIPEVISNTIVLHLLTTRAKELQLAKHTTRRFHLSSTPQFKSSSKAYTHSCVELGEWASPQQRPVNLLKSIVRKRLKSHKGESTGSYIEKQQYRLPNLMSKRAMAKYSPRPRSTPRLTSKARKALEVVLSYSGDIPRIVRLH